MNEVRASPRMDDKDFPPDDLPSVIRILCSLYAHWQ